MSVLPISSPDRREVRCRNRRCRRVLTDPESVALGYGPDCAELLGLVPPRVRVGWGRQDGPDLFDQHEEIDEGDETNNDH